ncbi:hypothetical protein DMUE_5259, partial [Dictyocoela muelleri]
MLIISIINIFCSGSSNDTLQKNNESKINQTMENIHAINTQQNENITTTDDSIENYRPLQVFSSQGINNVIHAENISQKDDKSSNYNSENRLFNEHNKPLSNLPPINNLNNQALNDSNTQALNNLNNQALNKIITHESSEDKINRPHNKNVEQPPVQSLENDTDEDTLSHLISKILTKCRDSLKSNFHSNEITANSNKLVNTDTSVFNNLLNDLCMLNQKITDSKNKYNPIIHELENYPADLNRIDENDRLIYSLKETKQVENDQIENFEVFGLINDKITTPSVFNKESIDQNNKSKINLKRPCENIRLNENLEGEAKKIKITDIIDAIVEKYFDNEESIHQQKINHQKQKISSELRTSYQSNITIQPSTSLYPNIYQQPSTSYQSNIPQQPSTSYQSNIYQQSNIQQQPSTSYQSNIQKQSNLAQQPNLTEQPSTSYQPYFLQEQAEDLNKVKRNNSGYLFNPKVHAENIEVKKPNNNSSYSYIYKTKSRPSSYAGNILERISDSTKNGMIKYSKSSIFLFYKLERNLKLKIKDIFPKPGYFYTNTNVFIDINRENFDLKKNRNICNNPFREPNFGDLSLKELLDEVKGEHSENSFKISDENYKNFLKKLDIYDIIQNVEKINILKYGIENYYNFANEIIKGINHKVDFIREPISKEEKLIIYNVSETIDNLLKTSASDSYISIIFPEIVFINNLYIENFAKHSLLNKKWYLGIFFMKSLPQIFLYLQQKFPIIENVENIRKFSREILFIRVFYIQDLLNFLNTKKPHLYAYYILSIKSHFLRIENKFNSEIEK